MWPARRACVSMVGGPHEAAGLLAFSPFGQSSSGEGGRRYSPFYHVGSQSGTTRILAFSPFGVERARVTRATDTPPCDLPGSA